MPAQQMTADGDDTDNAVMEYEIREPVSPDQLTEVVRGVYAAIDMVKTSVERLVSRAAEILH